MVWKSIFKMFNIYMDVFRISLSFYPSKGSCNFELLHQITDFKKMC